MLKFDHRGHLVPYGAINSTLEEVEEVFVTNMGTPKRQMIWNSFNSWLEELRTTLDREPFRIWINGSFVTQKRDPGDIDVVIFIPYKLRARLGSTLLKHLNPYSKTDYQVDAFVVEEFGKAHSSYPIFLADQAEWAEDFGTDRRSRLQIKPKKGFLEINC